MLRPLLAAALVAGLATPVLAQPSPQYDLIDPQRRTIVRQYVVRERVAPVTLPAGVAVTVGGTLPETVELRAFPTEIGVQYRYVVVGEQTVLVDPQTRRVIQVID